MDYFGAHTKLVPNCCLFLEPTRVPNCCLFLEMHLKTQEINGKRSQRDDVRGPGGWGSRPCDGVLPHASSFRPFLPSISCVLRVISVALFGFQEGTVFGDAFSMGYELILFIQLSCCVSNVFQRLRFFLSFFFLIEKTSMYQLGFLSPECF